MKNLFVVLGCWLMICFNGMGNIAGDSLKIVCTPDLEKLVQNWYKSFSSSTDGTAKIFISEITSDEKKLNKSEMAFISGESASQFSSDQTMSFVVGREIIVAVVNAGNPVIDDIVSKGISLNKLGNLISSTDKIDWGFLSGSPANQKMNLLISGSPVMVGKLAAMSNLESSELSEKSCDPAVLLSALKSDKYAIGICRLTDIQESESSEIRIIPIDRNGNGSIDYNENIYSDFNSFERGVWIGKYPKELVTNIYSVLPKGLEDSRAAQFISWVLSEGQNAVEGAGLTGLIPAEKLSIADKLNEARSNSLISDSQKSVPGNLIFATLLIIAIFAILLFAGYIYNRITSKPATTPIPDGNGVQEISYDLPKGMFFDKTHTWAFLEQSGQVKIGIDDFLLHLTGPLSRIAMKKDGDKVKKGEELLTIDQNGKKLVLYSPVSGTIRERNNDLEKNISLINSAPYSNGWIYRIQPENWQRENQLLFMAEKHKENIKNEIIRIKDIIVSMVGKDPQLAVALQDGGNITDGILSHMGPDVWEEIQQNVIDSSRQVWFYDIV